MLGVRPAQYGKWGQPPAIVHGKEAVVKTLLPEAEDNPYLSLRVMAQQLLPGAVSLQSILLLCRLGLLPQRFLFRQ